MERNKKCLNQGERAARRAFGNIVKGEKRGAALSTTRRRFHCKRNARRKQAEMFFKRNFLRKNAENKK
jgi:hypothetical protein